MAGAAAGATAVAAGLAVALVAILVPSLDGHLGLLLGHPPIIMLMHYEKPAGQSPSSAKT